MDIDDYKILRKKENVLGGFDTTKSLYRIFTLSRFCEALETKSLCLVKPILWDDPFENFLLSLEAYTKDGFRIYLENLRDTVFGQCWTLHYETDAMWRIYSHDKCGIKVKVNAKKLYNCFFETAESPELRCYIGEVDYLEDKKIVNKFRDPTKAHSILLGDGTGSELPKTLLVKRTEFEHEQEVRLIYSTVTDDPIISEKTYCFPIDPNDLFEEIEVDPRLEKNKFLEFRQKIKACGYKNEIKQSSLYKFHSRKITLDFNMGVDVNLLNKFAK